MKNLVYFKWAVVKFLNTGISIVLLLRHKLTYAVVQQLYTIFSTSLGLHLMTLLDPEKAQIFLSAHFRILLQEK